MQRTIKDGLKAKQDDKPFAFHFIADFTFSFLLLFTLIACQSSVPPPEQDPLYQALNSDSFSIGRPATNAPFVSQNSNDNLEETPYPKNSLANSPTNQATNSTKNLPDTNYNSEQQSNLIPSPGFIGKNQINNSPILNQPESDFAFLKDDCKIDEDDINEILLEVRKRKNNPKFTSIISTLPPCLKLNHALIMRAAIIDPEQFQYAADILKEDESFVRRMIEVNPQILKFASDDLKSDPNFMENATYLNRDSLQYANPKLLNNRIFMRSMINIDAKNYIFASNRLKEDFNFAQSAFSDNGLLLEQAPPSVRTNKKLVTIAVKSNAQALKFASPELQKNPALQKLAGGKSSISSLDNLKIFLQKNYINDSNQKNVGSVIDNRMKFFAAGKIIERNYITKWQRGFSNKNDDSLRLIAANSRNYPISWREDFKKFPLLTKKIEKFFLNRQVDQETIDQLKTVYFWKVKKKPQTVIFNLYLLRDSKDAELGPKFANVTSLTAIAQKQGENWNLSVVEVIFDSEIKIDLAYENGHKKYVLWDLYEVDKKDKNPKIIFKVEDRFSDYFEIFEEQNNGKYRMIYKIDSLRDSDLGNEKSEEKSIDDDF
ncbi:MAG: DUF4116 domain-containing protein [Rickettsiales bacterium]|nr:DUF4116 domain-containing protein [Rickettsiales bacterium]